MWASIRVELGVVGIPRESAIVAPRALHLVVELRFTVTTVPGFSAFTLSLLYCCQQEKLDGIMVQQGSL